MFAPVGIHGHVYFVLLSRIRHRGIISVGIIRLINGITRLINGTTRLINGIIRLLNNIIQLINGIILH